MLQIAIKSCDRDRTRGHHQVIRDTWAPDADSYDFVRYDFFLGQPDSPSANLWDEFYLDCPDDYDSLPLKTVAILKYFLRTEHDSHIFLCDTDTYIIPRKLLNLPFRDYDIAGRFGQTPALGTTFCYRDGRGNTINPCHPWPSGGVGYFLSRKAAKIVVETPIRTWAEDLHVGQALGLGIQDGSIRGIDLQNFENEVAWHFPRRMYGGQPYDSKFGWMEKMYIEHP